MVSICYLTMLVLLSLQARTFGSAIPLLEAMRSEPTMDNSLDPNAGMKFQMVNRDWVKINKASPMVVRRSSGSVVELECEASGSPAPTISWLRDNIPISDAEEYENNAIPESGANQIAQVISRLIIDNIVPKEKSAYTCLVQAGIRTAYHTTTVYTTGDYLKPRNITEYILLNKEILEAPSKPRIVLSYKMIMENIGMTLILPCKTVGKPRPEIFWFDNEEQLIPKDDPRRKIMPSGELVIQGLQWADMGGFMCIARNAFSKDSITTFVYPLMNES